MADLDAAADPQAPRAVETLLRAGRVAEAIAAAERQVRAAPAELGGWTQLARALLAARQPDAASAVCARARTFGVAAPELLCVQADALRSLGRTSEARALYERALADDPESFDAAFGLARLAVEAGDWVGARAWAARLSARGAGRPDLAWLEARAALGDGDFGAARTGFAALAADVRLAPEQRSEALLRLGEACDALGEPAAAFDAAVQGKAILRRLLAERAASREGASARFERLAAWFTAADPAPWRDAPAADASAAASHAFLVGFPRSGTTLLEQALAGHPQVVALEEAPTLAAAHAEFMGSPEALEKLARLTTEQAEHWRAAYWAEVQAYGVEPRGRLFLDKAPAGTVDLPLVAKLFPQAKVLFAVRDPRDVVLSCLRNSFQMNAMTYAFTDLAATAACYGACMRLAEVYRSVLPLEVLDVRHEALVDDFAAGLTVACRFLGLAPAPAMLDVAATARRRQVRTPSAPQVRSGLNRRGLGRWRAYADQLAPVLPALEPWVLRFGYEP